MSLGGRKLANSVRSVIRRSVKTESTMGEVLNCFLVCRFTSLYRVEEVRGSSGMLDCMIVSLYHYGLA